MPRTVVTGVDSGLGKYLHKVLDSVGTTSSTTDAELVKIQQDGIEVLIHCAWRDDEGATTLMRRMISLNPMLFVQLSSIEIYPKEGGNDGFTKAKRDCEELLNMSRIRNIILRPSMLLGKDMRPNSLTRMMNDEPLTIAEDSTFNYVTHFMVAEFIRTALKQKLIGAWNLVSNNNIGISRVATILEKTPQYGKYRYDCGDIPKNGTEGICSTFLQSSEEVIRQFCNRIEFATAQYSIRFCWNCGHQCQGGMGNCPKCGALATRMV